MTTASKDMRIGGEVIAAGTTVRLSLPVFIDLDGSQVAVPVHVMRGSRPGPTLTLLSMLHGDEWSMLQTLAELTAGIDAAALQGSLLVVPIGNPYAFRQLRRTSRETLEFDSADLNRDFPGDETWLTRRIARVITDEVLAKTTHLIDFHPGPFGSAWMQVVIGRDLPGDLPMRSEAMARAFGVAAISRALQATVLPGPRSASAYAGVTFGVPSIIAEVGGLGFDHRLERRWREQNIQGVLGVMKHLGMIDAAPAGEGSTEFMFFTRDWVVRPTTSGLLIPAIEPDRLGTRVEKGELLARIVSPTTFEELETLSAPRDGALFCVARTYPVQPHNYAYGAADIADPNTVLSR
jgi:predicted deacylase